MPQKKYTKTAKYRKSAKTLKSSSKYKSKRVPKAVVNRTSVSVGRGFPKKLQMTHRYSEIFTLSAGVTFGTYQFSCNGMYDPNITGTGHQPYYFDQMSALYDHYTVIGSKITVKMSPVTTTQVSSVCGLYINDDSTVTPSTVESLMENSSAKWKLLNINSSAPAVFTSKWSAKKTFGGSVLGNDNLQGTSGANPSEQSQWTLFVQPMDKTTSQNYYVEVDISYIAVWDELKDIAGS